MTTGKSLKKALKGNFKKASITEKLEVGETLKMLRELNELSQNALSELTSIPQSTLSGIEKGRIKLGVERAKVLARALRVHPAILLFPSWDTENELVA